MLGSLQYVCASLVLGYSELDPAHQVQPHQGWEEEEDHLPWAAGHALPNAAKNAISIS